MAPRKHPKTFPGPGATLPKTSPTPHPTTGLGHLSPFACFDSLFSILCFSTEGVDLGDSGV